MRRTRKKLICRRALLALAAVVLLGPATAHALDPVWSNWRGLAIAGYDPVAYFTDGKPVEGSSEFETTWRGATWRFASVAHRDQFVADPEKYAPQYGGYCAWAVAHDKTAGIDPEAWEIVDGKLYLNYSKDIQAQWQQDVPGYIAQANGTCPKLLGGH
jgi:YHS domain-containing protein